MKRPSFQLYPGDWLRDNVAGCSLAAQGLWLRLMLVMHDSEEYGTTSLPYDQLARRCGCAYGEFNKLLSELHSAGVPTITDTQIISRRMVADEAERVKAAARQRKFYVEHNAKPNGNLTPDLTETSREPHNHSSSSSSGTHPQLDQVLATAAQIGCPKEEAEKFWNHFESTGWIDKNGHPVMKWRNRLATWASDNRAADFQLAAKRKQNATHQRNHTESSRNVGTANEGKSGQYAGIGKVKV